MNSTSAGITQGSKVLRSMLGVCLFVSGSIFTQAQVATGRLTGTVRDTTGAAIPGATVNLTNDATGVVMTVPSTSTGTYLFEAVNPETYTLHAASPGFKGYTSPGIDLHIQQTVTVDIALPLGDATEQVTVEAAAPLLQAEDASIGQTIDKRAVDSLPLNGRDWVALGQLAAGVTTIAGGGTNSDYYNVNGINYFQNDFRLNGIDDNIEVYGGNPSNAQVIPPPDAIQEFKLQSGNYSAEFGHSTGAVINAALKSGGNQIHGDFWEYLRNDKFNANDYFSKQSHLAIPELRKNTFGGTVGGPVFIPKLYDGRNKTFFFFDYQGERDILAVTSTQTVPTPGIVSSGFTNLQDLISLNGGTTQDGLNRTFPIATVFDPSTTRTVAAGQVDSVSGLANTGTSDISVRDPFFTGASVAGITDFTSRTSQLNILPAARLDPNAIKLLQLFPAATRQDRFSNNYVANVKQPNTVNQYDVRADQNIGSKDVIFGVYDWSHAVQTNALLLPGLANGQNYGSGVNDFKTYAVAVGYTHLFTPSLTNEFHFGLNHLKGGNTPPEANTLGIPATFGIQGIPQAPGNGGLSPIGISGLSGLGVSPYMPTLQTIRTLEYSDNVTKNYRSQTIKVGVQLDSIEGDITQPPYGKGYFSYNGQYSSVPNNGSGLTGLTDLLLTPSASTVGGVDNVGGLSYFQGSNFSASNDHRYYMGAYVQDDWKVTPTLTLNLGLRWDRTTPYAEVRGHAANFIAANGNGPTGTYYLPQKTCSTPRSATFDATLQLDGIGLKCVSGLSLGNAQYSNFAPRLGFAYRVTPTFVARGGYGIAYGALDNIGYGGTINANYPFQYNVGFYSPNASNPLLLQDNKTTATFENAFSTVNLQDPSQVGGGGVSLLGRQYDFQTPYTQTFNFTLQKQVGRFDSFQAGYIGTLSRHLDIQGAHNSPSQLAPSGADLSKYVPFPDFSPNSAYETTNGASSYNSLQVVYSHAANHGLSTFANYTYSKCMSNSAEFGRANAYPRAEWLPGFGVAAENQLCDADATNVIHASGTYELPFGKGRQFLGGANRIVQTLVGGWAVNYIYTHQSGQPFTIGCPRQTNAFFGCNANVVPGQNLYAGPHNIDQWLNPKAFALPPTFQAGDVGFASLGGQAQQARGPGFNILDASFFKEFPIVEQVRLVFRAEAFNVANTPQFSNPGNLDFTNTTNFSQITGLRGNPRLLQLALKLYY